MSVRIEKSGPVFTVLLHRPARKNAVDRETAEALAGAFRTFEADEDAKVGVLYGEGGTFCAGADLVAVANGQPNRLEADGDGPMGPSRMALTKPMIAAISGHAVAGGLELALLCDLRVVERDAIMGVFCRRFGVPLIDGGTARLPRVVGLSRALDLILTGRAVGAEEAHRIGLADRVVERGQARGAAETLAREIASFPNACMLADRASTYVGLSLPIEEAIAQEFTRGVEMVAREGVEGATRFRDGAGRGGSFSD